MENTTIKSLPPLINKQMREDITAVIRTLRAHDTDGIKLDVDYVIARLRPHWKEASVPVVDVDPKTALMVIDNTISAYLQDGTRKTLDISIKIWNEFCTHFKGKRV